LLSIIAKTAAFFYRAYAPSIDSKVLQPIKTVFSEQPRTKNSPKNKQNADDRHIFVYFWGGRRTLLIRKALEAAGVHWGGVRVRRCSLDIKIVFKKGLQHKHSRATIKVLTIKGD
jgi:hypothetical protein